MTVKTKLTLDTYKAPWEVDADGNDIPEAEQEIDTDRLKKYLFGLISDKEKAVEARDTAQQELAAANEALNEKARKDESDEERRERERAERDRELEQLRAEGRKARALEVALSQDGITMKQAKALAAVLQGSTEEELDASAKSLIENFGLAKAAGNDGDDGDEGEDDAPRTRPRRLRTPGDPAPHTPVEESLEAQLAKIPRPGGSYY